MDRWRVEENERLRLRFMSWLLFNEGNKNEQRKGDLNMQYKPLPFRK